MKVRLMIDESDDWLYRPDMRPTRATPPPRKIITRRMVLFTVPFIIFCFLLGSWGIVDNRLGGDAAPLLLGAGSGALFLLLGRMAKSAWLATRE
jgi:hypothetical protein